MLLNWCQDLIIPETSLYRRVRASPEDISWTHVFHRAMTTICAENERDKNAGKGRKFVSTVQCPFLEHGLDYVCIFRVQCRILYDYCNLALILFSCCTVTGSLLRTRRS